MNTHRRRYLLILGRILVSLLLVGYLLTRTDRARLAALWHDIAIPLLVLAIGLQVLGIFISSLKWWLLLRAAGERLPYLWLVRLYLAGHFFSNFLPTMIGGDAVRVYQLNRRLRHPTIAISSVFVERLTGFLALTSIAWAAFLLVATTGLLERRILWIALWCIATATGGLALAFTTPFAIRFLSGLSVPNVFDWRGALERVRQSLAPYLGAPRTLVEVIGLGFAYQVSWIATNAAAAQALGLHVPVSVVALMVPLSDIVGLIPIFFNNLGAREGTFVLVLDQSDVTATQALGLSFLIYGMRLLVSLAGGLLYLFSGPWANQRPVNLPPLARQDQER